METVVQLKKIREDAIVRLKQSDDYKLIGKLGDLITELGGNLSALPADVSNSLAKDIDANGSETVSSPASGAMSSVIASTAVLSELRDADNDPSGEDVAEEIVDKLVEELASEDLTTDDEETDTEVDDLDSEDDDKKSAPAVSIFRSNENRFANGSAKSV